MLYSLYRIIFVIVSAFAIVSAECATAQSNAPQQHVPGELMIGFRSPKYRESLIRELERARQRHRLQVGSEILTGLSIEKSGNSGLILQIEFSKKTKDLARGDPGVELKLLEKFARQLKVTHPNITYAHPNWIDRIDPVVAPGTGNKL